MEEKLPKRKPTRLPHYDYASIGAYFLTICTEKRRRILSDIVGEGSALPRLTQYGEITDKWIRKIPEIYPQICVDYYVIMPNHIHLLLSLLNGDGRADPSPTVVDVIARIKYEITKEIAREHKTTEKIFQRSFHDHVIRDRADYDKIADYIDKNPLTWQYDCFYGET